MTTPLFAYGIRLRDGSLLHFGKPDQPHLSASRTNVEALMRPEKGETLAVFECVPRAEPGLPIL